MPSWKTSGQMRRCRLPSRGFAVVARATILAHSFLSPACLWNRSHAMRDRSLLSCDFGTSDHQRNDNNVRLAPTKPRLIMQNSSRVLHRKTGLTYRRETQLSRVAQHTALIGGDREAAAGTRQVMNGSGSSATSACFFGSFISDAGFVEPR
jgi:hypothetical protein